MHPQQTLLPQITVLTWRAFGVSTGKPGCPPRSLQLVISKFLYLPSCWDLWNLCSSLQAPSDCFLLSLLKLFPVHVQVGFIQGTEIIFFFVRYSGLIFCRSLLCSNLLPTALATQTLISVFFFSHPERLLFSFCVLFLCTIVMKNILEWESQMNVGHLLCICSLKDFSVDCCPTLGNIQTVLQSIHSNVLVICSSMVGQILAILSWPQSFFSFA